MPALRVKVKNTHCLTGLLNAPGLRDFVSPGIHAEWRPPASTGYTPEEANEEDDEDLPEYEPGEYED